MFGIGSQLQKVRRGRNKDGVRIIHLEIMTAEMMLAGVEVYLSQIFVRILNIWASIKRELIVRPVRERNVVQNVGSDRANRNLIVGIRRPSSRIHQLRARKQIRKVAGTFIRIRNGSNLAIVGGVEARTLIASKVKETILKNRTADASADLILLERIAKSTSKIIGW